MSESRTIGNAMLTARIADLGAELLSLTDERGREYITDGDPRYWTGHAPVLFPIIGELADGRYRLGDSTYALPRHGFARRSAFTCIEHQADRAVRFLLEDSDATRAVYPFAFTIEIVHELRETTLSTTATVLNRGEVSMPFSLGLHPGFAWPLPDGGAKLAHSIVFERDEPEDVRRLDSNGLLAESEATPVSGDTLALSPALFEDDALIWDRPASRSVSYRGETGARLDISFEDFPMLGIWQKPGAPFICIEPWAGLADPARYEGDLRDKPGIISLAPGARRSFRMDVRVRPG